VSDLPQITSGLKDRARSIDLAGSNIQPWCFTALRPRFFKLDAKAIFPLGLWLLHWRLWTFMVAIIGVMVMAALERWGLPPKMALGRLKVLLAGPYKPAVETSLLRRRAHW
jgi:intracellular multiplication protein IcmT